MGPSVTDLQSDGGYSEASNVFSGVKCIVYLLDVVIIDDDTDLLSRMAMHFGTMLDTVSNIVIISDKHTSQEMAKILVDTLESSDDIKSSGKFDLIGHDHEWVTQCDQKTLSFMVEEVIKQLKMKSEEVLFVGTVRQNKVLENVHDCQTYAIDSIDSQTHLSMTNSRSPTPKLKGEHLLYLESQIQ